nr:ABC transporter permease [Cyclobacteriaceae bacterium]
KSFDTFHSNYDRIYRAVIQSDGNNGKNYTPGVYPVFPEAFQNDFPEADQVTFISYRSGSFITVPQVNADPKRYDEEKGVAFAQPSFFKVFDRKILIGDATTGLDEPNEAILSSRWAIKYFGKEDAVNEVLKYEGHEYRVTAIMEDLPTNTDLPFDLLVSYITIKKEKDETGWTGIWSDEQCYFTLRAGSSISDIEARIPAFVSKYLGDPARNRDNATFIMQPFNEVHFDERFGNYNYSTISNSQLNALTLIGIFLLLTACINFINLTTAEAVKRSKEVGIRKALGSTRPQLALQFLGETTLITFFSILLALVVAEIGLTFINTFLDLSLTLNFGSDIALWVFLVSTLILVSLLSGIYPSLVVSGFNPISALKNQIRATQSTGFNLRRGLVVMQFFISQLLIIGTIVLISQMNFLKTKELGFRKEAVVIVNIPEQEIPTEGDGVSKMRALRNDLMKVGGVEATSLSSTPPSSGSVSSTDFQIEGSEEHYVTQVKQVDGNYLDLYRLELLAGAGLSDADTAQSIVVNEKLAQVVGYADPKEILGKRIKMWGKNLPVSGVVKNFHTVSLQDPMEATLMLNRIRGYETLSIKLNPQSVQQSLEEIQKRWEQTYPEFIYSYKFLEDEIAEFYEGEAKMSVMLTVFTSMAIFIGCLGLFGLTVFMANQKTKEIGVRKVLGASVENILFLFSGEFVRLILIGFVLAAPVSWYFSTKYLEQFAYKISIGPFVFILGLGSTCLIAFVTVGYRSIKAAMINPATSLRSE